MNLIVRRVLIILFLLMIMVTIEVTSEGSMLINLPSDEEVIDSFKDKLDVEDSYMKEINQKEREKQELEYNDLFNHEIKHTFIVKFSQKEWDGLIEDMSAYFVKYGTYKSNNYRKVDVVYIKDGEETLISDVGIRSKGNIYSRYLPIDDEGNIRDIHYMLKFNETFDYSPLSVKYRSLKTREVFNLEQLLFKRNNQWDMTYSNEVFSYDLFRKAGVVVPRASYAEFVIEIDGKEEIRSLYNIFEHYDEEFIRRYFQEERKNTVGDLYKGSWSGTLDPIYDDNLVGVRDWESNVRPIYSKETNKDEINYDNLIDFSRKINQIDQSEQLKYIENNFDTVSFMKAMAINVLVGNPDDYRGNGNNYYYYFDESDYMTYIPFDYDNSMGSGWDGLPAFIDYTLGNDIYEWGTFSWNEFNIPLWENLIKHEKYQIMYENYLMEYIDNGYYSTDSYKAYYDVVEDLYGDSHYLQYDKEAFIISKIAKVTNDVNYHRNKR